MTSRCLDRDARPFLRRFASWSALLGTVGLMSRGRRQARLLAGCLCRNQFGPAIQRPPLMSIMDSLVELNPLKMTKENPETLHIGQAS